MINKLKSTVLMGICLSIVGLPAIAKTESNVTKIAVAAVGNIQRDAFIVRIATGQAEKKSPNGEWLPLAIGTDLANDDIVKTGKNSTVLLELPENVGFIRLLPETEIKVNQIKVDRSFEGGQIAELSVTKGKVITKVRKFNRKSSKLQIHTKGATAAVRGTSFLTSFNENNETKVIVGDGAVSVKAQGEEVMVQPKEFTTVGIGNKPLNPGLVGSKMSFSISSLSPYDGKLNVMGVTDPDAEIYLNKVGLGANNDGTFNGSLSLKEGENQVSIKASTIDGRQKVSKLKVLKFTD
jgi:hypothetical protein